ncbi:MAG: UDP-N-acetylglucosamine 1-carboxyvinyltransferase [Patescibacteria group bacterium]
MSKFIIEGGTSLRGTIKVSGSKNAALPIIAATLMTDETCKLTNVPRINDVENLLKIMAKLGTIYDFTGNDLTIRTEHVKSFILDTDLVRKLRASILLMGPLLARTGKCKMVHPGGCIIGKRPIGVHFDALRAMGVKITQDEEYYLAEVKKIKLPERIYLDEVSVTATENAIMAASLGQGRVTITPAACEPHVKDLAEFLQSMGAEISGEGTHEIIVTGTTKLNGTNHKIISDEVEAGTFAIAGIATKGKIKLQNAPIKNLEPIIFKLKQMGAEIEIKDQDIIFSYKDGLKATKIQVDTWPRLPSDIQPPFTVLATQVEGTSLIHDWLYDRRFGYIDDISRMGANITLCDPHRILVTGPTKLYPAKLPTIDLRAGAAVLIAAFIAKGTSEIEHAELIDRGYEKLDKRLDEIGARIRRVD